MHQNESEEWKLDLEFFCTWMYLFILVEASSSQMTLRLELMFICGNPQKTQPAAAETRWRQRDLRQKSSLGQIGVT